MEFNEVSFNIDDRSDKSNNISFLKGISLASKNCNSLNVSSNKNFNIKTNKLSPKIIEILKIKADCYLLQDIRLSSSVNQEIFKKELECHKYGSYDSYINSNKSNRGTAILVRRNLNYKVIREFSSNCNNICIIDCIINNFRLSIISTYAPIQTGNLNFFPNLKKKILEIGNTDFILMGDLNSTHCTTPANLGNIDCLNMINIPNPVHCSHLNSWIESNFAYDLYRLINPSKKDFSYVPFGVGNKNRSRIDHCFISPGLINLFNFCEYSESKSSLFDHKTMIIKSNKIKKKLHSSIDPNLIDLPGLYDCVKFELIELFVNNFDLENSQVLIDTIPLISITSNEIYILKNSPFSNDLLLKQLILNKEEYLETLCSIFPTVEEILEHECRIEPDLFLDVLFNCMKNCIISFQSNYKKKYNSHKLKLSLELSNLKASSVLSDSILDKIFSIELELSKLENEENIRILENSKHFQIINNEKPSKMYCKLLKNNKSSDSLDLLLDENNLPFDSTIKRDKFIVKHFETKFSTPFTPSISLNDFFDNNTINDPLLNSHKLSNDQRLELDKEISLSELDHSLKTSNKNSAPGPDGIPTSILFKFWKFLRIPMLRGFKTMVRKKKMTPLLRCSRIKLIPKSNYPNITSLGRARPIANVCSPYKILSGVISHRIETILETVIYKAQKAYSKTNIIAEPLLYTFELMSKAIETKTSLCVMNVDFSAAFDTISIKFLEDVLRFFNFGNFFINLVITTLTDRYGYVCTNEGQTGIFFIKVGCLQGDRSSCHFFKLCLNVLILYFVITKKVTLPPAIPFKLKILDPKPDPISAFADDYNKYFKPSIEALQFIYDTLNKFKDLSGLAINAKKTSLCIIGPPANDEFCNLALNLGFKFVDNFKLLGINFDKTLTDMNSNWNKCINKIISIRNFWGLFNLTCPGKLNIIKCFLLPQITYLGSILSPPEEIVDKIENIIFTFLNQNNVRVAKCKIFAPTTKGGLGVPNIRAFLKSLDLLLIKKSLSIKDAWSSELRNFSFFPNDLYFTSNIDKRFNPVLHRLINSYIDFQHSFWIVNNNILDMYLFDNIFFVNATGEKISQQLFSGNTWNRYSNDIKCLKFSNVLTNDFKNLEYNDFKIKTNINITLMEFWRLNSIIRFNINLNSNKFLEPQTKLKDIFKKTNVKSKFFRKYFEANTFDISKMKTTINRYAWVELNEINVLRELRWQQNWNYSFLTMEIKNFSFKLLNNQIKLNAHISHFDENISACCTFCSVSKSLPAPKEDLKHFFVDCPTTNNFSSSYFNRFLSNTNINYESNWLLIGAPQIIPYSFSLSLNIEIILMCLFLFKCRSNKRLPNEQNHDFFLSWHKKLFCKSFKYASSINLFSNPYDPG